MSRLFFIDDASDRSAEARLAEADFERLLASPQARILLVRRGRVKAHEDPPRIAWHARDEIPGLDDRALVFIGLLERRPCFALVPAEPPLKPEDRLTTGYGREADGFLGLYDAAMSMAPAEARLAARAVHFANWVNRTRHCGACGAPMSPAAGGRRRRCTSPGCGREEFPRIDPVVIVLVSDGERCLLGRQPRFPPRRYSTIAGFAEPGETLEEAVRREVAEEAGLVVGPVQYFASQPWPFPNSLMVGFFAQAAQGEIALNDGELEDARWFTRAEVAAAADGQPDAVALPPAGSIARRLIEHWLRAHAPPAGG